MPVSSDGPAVLRRIGGKVTINGRNGKHGHGDVMAREAGGVVFDDGTQLEMFPDLPHEDVVHGDES